MPNEGVPSNMFKLFKFKAVLMSNHGDNSDIQFKTMIRVNVSSQLGSRISKPKQTNTDEREKLLLPPNSVWKCTIVRSVSFLYCSFSRKVFF